MSTLVWGVSSVIASINFAYAERYTEKNRGVHRYSTGYLDILAFCNPSVLSSLYRVSCLFFSNNADVRNQFRARPLSLENIAAGITFCAWLADVFSLTKFAVATFRSFNEGSEAERNG